MSNERLYKVAGVTFEGRQDTLRDLCSNARVHYARLEKEPDNPYDKRAVAVYCGDSKIGYIPKASNAFLNLAWNRIRNPRVRIDYYAPSGTYSALLKCNLE